MPRKLEVVVVDDKTMITDLFVSFINILSDNTNVHSFNDAVKAREFIKGNSVDVLITDYNMPDVNGLQLMKATKPGTMRIMISGYVSEIAEERLHELDAYFFEKPVPMKQIGKLISERETNITREPATSSAT